MKLSKERSDWLELLGAPLSPKESTSDSSVSLQSGRSEELWASPSAPATLGGDPFAEVMKRKMDDGTEWLMKRSKPDPAQPDDHLSPVTCTVVKNYATILLDFFVRM